MRPLLISSILLLTFHIGCAGHQKRVRLYDRQLEAVEHLYLVTGDMKGAIRSLEALDTKAQRSPKVSFLLADILDSKGNPTEALEHYFRTIEIAHSQGFATNEAIAAAMGIVAIRDRVNNFKDSLDDMFERIKNSPGKLPKEAWFQLQNLKLGLSRIKGDEDGAKAALRATGCLTKWSVAGPIGPLVWTEFQRALPPAPGNTWPVSIDLGPGRSKMPFESVEASTCFSPPLNRALPNGGVSWYRTTVSLDKTEKVFFRLQSLNGVRVFAGNKELFSRDPKTSWPSHVLWFEADLPSGATELSVAVATTNLSPSFSLLALTEESSPAFSGQGLGALAVGLPVSKPMATPLDLEVDMISRYAALKVALWWDDIELAFKLIEGFKSTDGTLSPALLVLEAEATGVDPSLPGDVAYERARSIEEAALKKEPRLWQMRIKLSDRARSDGKTTEALALLNEGVELSNAEPELLMRLASTFGDEGWTAEVEKAARDIASSLPNSCNTISWQLSLARRHNNFKRALELARELSKCDTLSPALAEELIRAQKWRDAIVELERLARREPLKSSPLIDVMQAAIAEGDLEKAGNIARRAAKRFEADAAIRLTLSDILLSIGDTEGSMEVIEQGLALAHAPKLPFLKARATLTESQILKELRVDGPLAITDYEAENPGYDTASVFVLDRAVYVVGEFGDVITIVHTITHLKTDEAIESNGEFALPPGAILLKARTIKPDGRILEPEFIVGKPTFSLPALEAGDYIETEYVTHNYPNMIYPGGFDTGRFYFQNFETAFHRSEIVVSAPDNMEIGVDPRGEQPVAEEKQIGERKVLMWRARGMLPVPAEPLSPVATEYLPSVRVYSGVTFENVLNRMRDLLCDMSRPSRHIDSTLKNLFAGKEFASDFEKRRAIYEFVMENIEHVDDIFEQASHIVSSKSGNRARAFHALLESAGYSSRLALVKPAGLDETPNSSPDFTNWSELLVHVPEDGWISFRSYRDPYGFLPPRLRFRPARFVDTGEISKLNGGSVAHDLQSVDVEFIVAQDGSSTARIRETLEGIPANDWRLEFSQTPRKEWEARFLERYLSSEIPGADLVKLEVRNLEEPFKPLLLVYEIKKDKFTRKEASHFTASIPFPITLFKQIGGLPARATPLILTSWIKKKVNVKITLDGPGSLSLKPTQDKLAKSPWGSAKRWENKSENTLNFGYEAELSVDRINANEYQEFLDFANKVDRISYLELVISNNR